MKEIIKKIVLRKWVQYVLAVINVVMFIIMASDMVDTAMFVISHTIAGIVFMFNSYILLKYSRLIEE